MKMKKLASLIDPMPNDSAGFAKFASPEKRKAGVTGGDDGFAQIVNKKKRSQNENDVKEDGSVRNSQVTRSLLAGVERQHILNKNKCSRSANIGKEDGFAPSSQVSRTIIHKAGYTSQVKGDNQSHMKRYAQMRRFRSPAENIMVHSGLDVSAPSGQPAKTQSEQRIPTQSGQLVPSQSGQPAKAQSEQRISTKSGQRVPSKSGQHVPSQSGQPAKAQSEQRIPTKSGQRVPSQSRQRVPSQSGQQHVRAHSEKETGQHIQAHTQQSFHAQSQSGIHSPTQSRQRTSQSGQSTPNASPQLTAQSRQHTPEPQSQQRPSDAQSEPNEHTPTPSHPSTLNVSSTAANDNVRWNIGFTQRDGRMRVEVIKGILEPSNKCSAKIRQIRYERLELKGYNWKSVSEVTKSFYFEEFKKYFVWRQSDKVIYQAWLGNARKKYSEVVSVARSDWEYHNRRDNRIDENVHVSWVKFWSSPDFQAKSLIQKGNRRSGCDGRPSTHTSGSASHRTIAARWRLQHKRDPTADELFYLTHTRRVKKNKILIGDAEDNEMDDEDDEEGEVVWIDKKSQQIYETFIELCKQQEKSGEPVDKNALFLKAVGGPDKKNRVYGLGSSQSIFYESTTTPYTSTFANEEENQKLKDQLTEMNERMKAMENQLAMIMETNSVRLTRSSADLDGENDN